MLEQPSMAKSSWVREKEIGLDWRRPLKGHIIPCSTLGQIIMDRTGQGQQGDIERPHNIIYPSPWWCIFKERSTIQYIQWLLTGHISPGKTITFVPLNILLCPLQFNGHCVPVLLLLHIIVLLLLRRYNSFWKIPAIQFPFCCHP